MTDDRTQISVYVSGHLAAWGKVSRYYLQGGKPVRVDLRTDKAHDPYGIFGECKVMLEPNPYYWHKDARSD
jgi:hypothetical protein